MNKAHLISNTQVFGGFYNQWRLVRVWKLEQIFGPDWFIGKRVLELGCGYGNIGVYLKTLGADVLFADARQEFLDIVRKKCPTAETVRLDQDTAWNLNEEFDLVIHWGITYNIKNWEQDLECTLKHAKNLAYETAVNKFAGDVVIPIVDPDYGVHHSGCYNNEGVLPSVMAIEQVLPNTAVRYEDHTMNCYENLSYTDSCTEQYTGNPEAIQQWNDNRAYGGRKYWVMKV